MQLPWPFRLLRVRCAPNEKAGGWSERAWWVAGDRSRAAALHACVIASGTGKNWVHGLATLVRFVTKHPH